MTRSVLPRALAALAITLFAGGCYEVSDPYAGPGAYADDADQGDYGWYEPAPAMGGGMYSSWETYGDGSSSYYSDYGGGSSSGAFFGDGDMYIDGWYPGK